MYYWILLLFIADVNSIELEIVNFDEALEFWRQIIETSPDKLEELSSLLNEDKALSRKDIIVKVGKWSKANELQDEFSNFVQEKGRLYHKGIAAPLNFTDSIDNQVSKLNINRDMNISFKESCKRQNRLIRSASSNALDRLGFKQLNIWCE